MTPVEQARWDARREVAALLRGEYQCPGDDCTHGNEWACAADLIDVQDDLVPEVEEMSPAQPCRNCGQPVSESPTYGWLHVGGWKLCGKSGMGGVARPVATQGNAEVIDGG